MQWIDVEREIGGHVQCLFLIDQLLEGFLEALIELGILQHEFLLTLQGQY